MAYRADNCQKPNRGVKKYIVRGTGGRVVEVMCALCSTTISRMKERNGREVLLGTGNYTEITIRFDDGSAHEACVCKQCAKSMTTEKLEYLYATHCADYALEESTLGLDLGQAYYKALDRKIVGHEYGSRFVKKGGN